MEDNFDTNSYLNMELLRFTTAGSVDDGKSTLIGRLLYDSKSIFEDQVAQIEATSTKRGLDHVDLSLFTDGLKDEREQGITIDVAYRYFATPKRKFIIADTPGHVQYTRNMVTGASTANLALILVDARKGVIELVSGTSRGIRLRGEALRDLNDDPDRQMMLPIAGLNQLLLPLVGRVAAGSPILAAEHVEQSYHLEPSLFQRRPDYLLKVRGMSMRDAGILDGDLLAVQTTREARNGQIIVARLGEDVTVKRFWKSASHIELRAENPDFSTIVVQPDEPFDIEGLAVGLIRNTVLN